MACTVTPGCFALGLARPVARLSAVVSGHAARADACGSGTRCRSSCCQPGHPGRRPGQQRCTRARRGAAEASLRTAGRVDLAASGVQQVVDSQLARLVQNDDRVELPAASSIDSVADSLLPAAWTDQVPGLTVTKEVTLANFSFDASLVFPAVTVMVFCCMDA